MSADSSRKQHKPIGTIIRPQLVSDTTVIESVVNFIQDVVPSYANNPPRPDDRDKILWLDFQNVKGSTDHENNGGDTSTLLQLIVGYSDGIQCWVILVRAVTLKVGRCPLHRCTLLIYTGKESGEAYETLSLRNCAVRFAKILPPSATGSYCGKAPLMIVCDASSSGGEYRNLKLTSLKTGDLLENRTFNSEVVDLKCNQRFVAASFSDRIAVFDSQDLREKFTMTSCYPCPGLCSNPIALGDRWIAYADKKLVPMHQSSGGMAADGRQSYTATMISAAKTITKGLTIFGETVATTLTGVNSASSPDSASSSSSLHRRTMNSGLHAGVVTIVDICNVKGNIVKVSDDFSDEGLIAHFPAHTTAVSSLTFNSNGSLLLTTDKNGHDLFIFRVMTHPRNCSLGAVHHLYTLHRGDTTAKVQHVCFTIDSRWVAITTLHGTTHIFPITPYGGAVSIRTHTSSRVVNRSSKFQRSAGLDDLNDSSRRRTKSTGNITTDKYVHITSLGSLNNNARLPPFPHPTNISCPITQFKHGLSLPGIKNVKHGKHISQLLSSQHLDTCCVSVCFAASRGHIAGATSSSIAAPSSGGGNGGGGGGGNGGGATSTSGLPEVSLFIVSWTGVLIEYVLVPGNRTVNPSLLNNTVTSSKDLVLDVCSSAKAQWSLIRSKSSKEMKPPLHHNNALIRNFETRPQTPPTLPTVSGAISSQSGRYSSRESLSSQDASCSSYNDEDEWLSQVEISTHVGPHRRLWMGPQFTFHAYQGNIGGADGDAPFHENGDVINELRHAKLTISNPVLISNQKFKQNDCLYIQSGSYEHQPSMNMNSLSWQGNGVSNNRISTSANNYNATEDGCSRLTSSSCALSNPDHDEDKICESIADAMLDSGTVNHFSNNFTIDVDTSSNTPSSSYDSLNRLLENECA